MAILSLVCGSFWSCCNVLGLVSPDYFIENAAPDEAAETAEQKSEPGWSATWGPRIMWVSSLVELPIGILMLVVGVGLLRRWSWARTGAKVCAYLVILGCLWAIPLTLWEWQLQTEPSADWGDLIGKVTMAFASIAQIVAIVLWMAYAVAMLIVLRGSTTKAAFAESQRGRDLYR